MRATELSTIAIDDFYMTQFSGSCDTLPPDHVTPAPTDAPSLWECDFENGHLCSMYGMGEATWVVLTGENTDHDDGRETLFMSYTLSFANRTGGCMVIEILTSGKRLVDILKYKAMEDRRRIRYSETVI